MRIAFVSTYVPRKCGIATYTKDLAESLKKQGVNFSIIVLENEINLNYPPAVRFKICEEAEKDYIKAAEYINKSNIDLVHIQHEFGIFGGKDGEYILSLARNLTKPFLVTFHTTLLDPSPHQKEIIQELKTLSRGVITMEDIGKDRLIHVYNFHEKTVNVIYHGVPSMNDLNKTKTRKELGWDKDFIIMSSNLISRNKGLEYVIEAMPEILKDIPNAKFIVVGETHPSILKREGEKYRDELILLAKKLRIEENIIFINKYVDLDTLKKYFCASDIFVTPYIEPQQITSGTLSYAIGAGKVCISTPYIYAKNILKEKRGIIVPFKNSSEIAKSVINVYQHPKLRKIYEKNASDFGKKMQWSTIALSHKNLYKTTLKYYEDLFGRVLKHIKKPIDTRYLFSLTDSIGIAQHSRGRLLDTRHGYSTDDNARALIVASDLYKRNNSQKIFQKIKSYLGFLLFAQEEDGKFHTFLGPNNTWLDTGNVNDAYAKAIWGLGRFLYLCQDSPFEVNADKMLRLAMRQIPNISSIRTASFAIIGLYYYYEAFADKKDSAEIAYTLMENLANFIVSEYEKTKDSNWHWFENTATYDNYRIPQALLLTFLATQKEIYKKVALESLKFLQEYNYNSQNKYFDFIGQNGWLTKGKEKAKYDQQPLEAAAAVSTLSLAYKITKDKKYSEKAIEAFSWFFGNNCNHSLMIDDLTGGIYDGLTPFGINDNQGSESIICFMIAQFDLLESFRKD